MSAQEVIEKLTRKNPFKTADEAFVRFLREQGLSRIESIRVITQIFGLRLGEAKEPVHFSETWRAEKASAEQLWDELEQELQDFADGNWLTGYWRRRRLPLVPGIFHADGRIAKLAVSWRALSEPGRFAFDVSMNGEATVAELGPIAEQLGSMMMRDLPAIDSKRNLAAYCGEGSFGADGYVALLQADSGKPIWIAFFDESNPFVSVEFSGSGVVAISNHGNRWLFPIDMPERVTVT